MKVSLRNFIITFVAALVVFGGVAFAVTSLVSKSLGSVLDGGLSSNASDTVSDTSAQDPQGDTVEPIEIAGESFSVLLIGTDYLPSYLHDYHPDTEKQYPAFGNASELIGTDGDLPEKAYRTVSADAVVLLRVDKEKKQFTYTAFPSNMLLSINGTNITLGDLYYEKGLEFFIKKITAITGIDINYYAVASIEGFVAAVDEIDGVTYTVPCDMEYEDPTEGLKISLKAGKANLSGADVSALVRYRGYTSSGQSRMSTLISVAKAVATKLTNPMYMNKLADMFTLVSKYISTNFSAKAITDNIDLIFSYSSFGITEIAYPGTTNYESDGTSTFKPNISAAITTFAQYRK